MTLKYFWNQAGFYSVTLNVLFGKVNWLRRVVQRRVNKYFREKTLLAFVKSSLNRFCSKLAKIDTSRDSRKEGKHNSNLCRNLLDIRIAAIRQRN